MYRSLFVLLILLLCVGAVQAVGGEGYGAFPTLPEKDSPFPFGPEKDTSFPAGPEKRVSKASKILEAPKIDGRLDDQAWKEAAPLSNFTEFEPNNGAAASERTEVRILYDNVSVYIGAKMYDSKPDKISKQLGDRDSGDDVNTDLFGIGFDTYDDNQNGFIFFVSAAGVQTDVRISQVGWDEVWDGVWNSSVQIEEDGWSVEMEIPYSALRFPAQKVQTWGVQCSRGLRRTRQTFYWNYQGRDIDGEVNQWGELQGIEGIDPPVRLSLLPYVSYYRQFYNPGKNSSDPSSASGIFNAGADLKYGISDGFTLDMTLVPDFGQVVSDNQVLNLSPFEVRFQENRPFFTEGTELFNIANVFYSRRIGAQPRNYSPSSWAAQDSLVLDEIKGDEVILNNPNSSKLVNAFKISGRTQKKTGLGVFNAMTSPMRATISGPDGTREVITQDFTNYNVAVVDQSISKNSFASLINTNRMERGGYMANVTASRLRLADDKNNWFLFGEAAMSQRYEDMKAGDGDIGYKYYYELGKNNGNFTFNVGQNVESDNYNPNDMGFLMAPNEYTNFARFRYNIYKPFWKLVGQFNSLNIRQQNLYAPRKYQSININYDTWFQFKSFDFAGLFFFANPGKRFDYFESRTGAVFNLPGSWGGGGFLSTNYARRWALDINYSGWTQPSFDARGMELSISPRFRVSDRLQFIHTTSLDLNDNSRGFVTFDEAGNSLIGIRDRKDVVNTFNTIYSFTSRMNLNFRLRHYWSRVSYDDILVLEESGDLGATNYNENEDINFNVFNIDCVFRWRFAPGSDVFIVWKNSILEAGDQLINSFGQNLQNTFQSPQTNSISVRVLYYIDFARLRKRGTVATTSPSKP